MLTITYKRLVTPQPAIALGLVYLLIAFWLLPGYLSWDGNLFIGLILTPFICSIDRTRFSLRYLAPALIAVTLAVLVPVKTLIFIALLFTTLLFVENSLGKVSDSFMFLLFLVSPAFRWLSGLADFPMRLWLTGRTTAVLNIIGVQATAAGNQIRLANGEFSVDPACAGLNMLVISLILFLFVTMHYQRQTGKQFRFFQLAVFFIATIGLNVVCNFFRILLLVGFKIMPGTFFHDFVGIGCLVVYVLTPLITGVKPLLKRFGRIDVKEKSTGFMALPSQVRYLTFHCLLLLPLLFSAFNLTNADAFSPAAKEIKLPGFTKYTLDNGIIKFVTHDALIYIKPTAFYIPAHDPMICWTGSGYRFKSVRNEKLNGVEMYTGILENGKDKIYAAWWFDNSRVKTINQLEWRWRAAKGQHSFYLININTTTRQDLLKQVSALLGKSALLK